jgi:hypothetical protein
VPENSGRATGGWTVDTSMQHFEVQLREFRNHVDQLFRNVTDRFDVQEKAVDKTLTAATKAVDAAFAAATQAAQKQEEQNDKWRASANEWREAMNDREKNFMPRVQADEMFKTMRSEITDLKASRDNLAGGLLASRQAWGYLVGLIGIGVGVAALFWRHGP